MNILRQRVNTQVKLGHIACRYKCTQYFEVQNYAKQSKAKKF